MTARPARRHTHLNRIVAPRKRRWPEEAEMITMTKTRVAEALFVSDLQPSQTPTTEMVKAAIDRMIRRYGFEGCAARMASEFGDHPDLAVRRMIWVRRIMSTAALA